MSTLARTRALAQLLHRPRGITHPADVAKAICGAQAQDMRHGRLAFRARNPKLTAADVERARGEERSLLHVWAMRNTMHLIATEDAEWLLPLFEPIVEAFIRRRLAQLGVDARRQERALTLAEEALSAGPLSRTQLIEELERSGIKAGPEARGHLCRLTVAGGAACLGPMSGKQTLLVARGDWLAAQPHADRDNCLAELARRYVGAFGPTTEHDFAKWAGLPLRDIRTGLSLIAGELREVGAEILALRRRSRRATKRIVRLLPAWDTFWMGYRDREFAAPNGRWDKVSDGGGMIAPAALADGTAIARWRAPRRHEDLASVTDWFERPSRSLRTAVDAELQDIARFESDA